MRVIIILLSILLSNFSFCQSEKEVLNKANKLIEQKKYESAFNVLESFDSINILPNVVLLKTEILLKYYVMSFRHSVFSLKDIEVSENILDYRGKFGAFSMKSFQADSIISNLLKKHPKNCKLHEKLGDFYTDIYSNYRNDWEPLFEEVQNYAENSYKKAIDNGCNDYLIYYKLALLRPTDRSDEITESYFLKSIELNEKYALSHFDLAFFYFDKVKEKSHKYFLQSFELFNKDEQAEKSISSVFIAKYYEDINNNLKAQQYYETADSLNPHNKFSFQPLLKFYLKTNNPKADQISIKFFNRDPENGDIYETIFNIYLSSQKNTELFELFNKISKSYEDKPKILGLINYFLAYPCLENDKNKAKYYYKLSIDYFKKHLNNINDNKICGIGAQLQKNGNDIVVKDILPGSPADLHGELKIGDKILKIVNNEGKTIDVSTYEIQDILPMIRGKNGTIAQLTIVDGNNKPKTISIKRKPVGFDNKEQDEIDFINKLIENIESELLKLD